MITTNSVIPAQAGIQQEKHSAKRTTFGLVPLRGDFSINWIPAYAGMTKFMLKAR
jgi:hypothetical protein